MARSYRLSGWCWCCAIILIGCGDSSPDRPLLDAASGESGGSSSSSGSSAPTDASPPTSSDVLTTDPGGTADETIGGVGGTTGEATTMGEATTSTGPPLGEPYCGDSLVGPGEACDPPSMGGTDPGKFDYGDCSDDCTYYPRCGDGVVQEAFGEVCDPPTPGVSDSDVPYGACSSDCRSWPRCGDGILQQDEELCDAPDIQCVECRGVGRFVFRTSAVYSGDLGGITGADQKCNDSAQGKLPGVYRAWMLADPDDAEHPGQDTLVGRFQELVTLGEDAVFLLPDGVTIVGEDFQQFLGTPGHVGSPMEPIVMTEAGVPAPAPDALCPNCPVWSNVGTTGALTDKADCARYTSIDGSGTHGIATATSLDEQPQWGSGRWWTAYFWPRQCKLSAHLYCFQIEGQG